jgi:hypothetical protein
MFQHMSKYGWLVTRITGGNEARRSVPWVEGWRVAGVSAVSA